MSRPRLPYRTLAPKVFDALLALEQQVQGLNLDAPLLELVKVRASQLNGCGFCLDMHSRDALKVGVPQRQLLVLAAWREAGDLFTPRERALLAFTEAVTLLSQAGVPDALLEELRAHFTDAEIVSWTLAVITINAWNRMGVVAGLHPA
ncbi:hypothetical protein Dcar01_00639 [Deinococcus carri]|uniref:Carboxymuconolactone decarboxylase-like domain-containing protein n=1 Tax=Deinococcus carri TaxID=1211323 RepID=A0ABP9W630_9DEIO